MRIILLFIKRIFIPCKHLFTISSGHAYCAFCRTNGKIEISAQEQEDLTDIHTKFIDTASKIIIKNIADLEKSLIKKYKNDI